VIVTRYRHSANKPLGAAGNRLRGQTVPERVKTDDLVDWRGETVRQIDSSLLDEWEALTDPQSVARAAADAAAGEALAPVTANERAFGVMIRNSMFHKVQLAARDRFAELGQLKAAAAALTQQPRSRRRTECR
jgi:Domain of unknown function (DUF3516)